MPKKNNFQQSELFPKISVRKHKRKKIGIKSDDKQ
jgi:hypothetical protein